MKERRAAVAIIGAGTAGINALSEVRKVTDDFLLINDGPLGTMCARVGCMPSKLMIQVADDYHRRLDLSKEGIQGADRLTLDTRRAMIHIRELRDGFVGGVIEDVMAPLGDKLMQGQAEFIEPNVLQVGATRVTADRVVIATGSRPVIPEGWGHLGDRILTTDTIFEQEDLPPNLAVLGLGAVGLELGLALKRMGLSVTAFDQVENVGGLRDPEINAVAREIFEKELTMVLGVEAEIEAADPGLRLHARGRTYAADKLLLSVGRAPNVEALRLERLGVPLDDRGVPVYDRQTMQVADLPLFIAGDVTGDRPILHEAAHEGAVAGYNAAQARPLGFRRKAPLTICFSGPDICSVGRTWDDIRDRRPAVGSARFRGGREKIMLRSGGMIRVYADPGSGDLWGAEMVAPHGEHLAHLLAWSIQQNLTVFDLLAMPYYHPTVEETLKNALRNTAQNVATQMAPLPGLIPVPSP